jgi:putative transposase
MPGLKNRKQIRLPNFDYSENGYYFVTVSTYDRRNIFGRIENNQAILNDAGNMIDFWWSEIPVHFCGVRLEQRIIMPNHIHAIINIVGADRCVRPILNNNTPPIPDDDIRTSSKTERYPEIMGRQMSDHDRIGNDGRTHRSAPTVSGMIQWFKTMSTNDYIRNVKNNGWPPFNKRLWQRSFHDHIIRNERSLNAIRRYIAKNPVNWEQDIDNLINL